MNYSEIGKELGELVDKKQKAYGNSVMSAESVLKVYLKPYEEEYCYVIPKELIRHLLIIVRILDKVSRIFASPSGDLLGENPYRDIAGYGLIGQELTADIITDD